MGGPGRQEAWDANWKHWVFVRFRRDRFWSTNGTNTVIKGFDSHQLAADAIGAQLIDFAIADKLAAEFIVAKNDSLAAVPLYYTEEPDYPVEESYAIAVNKDRTELLEAFNEVLAEMTKKDPKGISEIDRLVVKYMGLGEKGDE